MNDCAELPAMSLTTYTFVVRENESSEGIVAEVRADGTIEESTTASYDDYGLTSARDDGHPDERETEVAADVRTIRLQTARDGEGFSFRLLGDNESIAEQRVTDEEWNLTAAE